MNGDSGYLANPVSQSLIVASGALLQQILSSLAACGTAMKKQSKNPNQKNAIKQQLFLKIRNGNIRSTGKPSTPKAEEGYCNKATQSRPLTHSQSPTYSRTQRGKTQTGLDKRGGTRSDMVLHALQTALYRKLQDRNVIQKEAEKILKYKDLTIEIQLM
jgi:hypothetical protein